jgi:hypothetical protein
VDAIRDEIADREVRIERQVWSGECKWAGDRAVQPVLAGVHRGEEFGQALALAIHPTGIGNIRTAGMIFRKV